MLISPSSGVQLHITSLPSRRLGREAYAFVDWLSLAGQSYWQVLPLGPPDRFRSPYRARSAFACSPSLLGRPHAPVSAGERADFIAAHQFWLPEWAGCNGGREAIDDQIRFQREWLALRAYAKERGVHIIGDLPLYVSPGSVDHRMHPHLFADGLLGGAPPDRFSRKGQLWGNPVYNWPAMRRERYSWWVERIRRSLELFDLIRLDHFRGFVAYWAVPEGSRDARGGRWRRGPQGAPIQAARRALGELPLIAEDLGRITPAVQSLRSRLDIRGMAVLQFLFAGGQDAVDGRAGAHPLHRQTQDRILYTSTHDQTTLLAWWTSLQAPQRSRAQAALRRARIDPAEGVWALIRLALTSPAPLVIMQAQDVLCLPEAARMNTPGRASGNWAWRLEVGSPTQALAGRLRDLTRQAGRLR